jgi:hypothetical protein
VGPREEEVAARVEPGWAEGVLADRFFGGGGGGGESEGGEEEGEEVHFWIGDGGERWAESRGAGFRLIDVDMVLVVVVVRCTCGCASVIVTAVPPQVPSPPRRGMGHGRQHHRAGCLV